VSAWSFLILDVIQAVLFQWPLWLALIAVQVVTLLIGAFEYRWLPSGLLGIGLVWCLAAPVLWK
jgi:hypothetical protein